MAIYMNILLKVIAIKTYIKEINITDLNLFLSKVKSYSLKNNVKIQCLNASMIYN